MSDWLTVLSKLIVKVTILNYLLFPSIKLFIAKIFLSDLFIALFQGVKHLLNKSPPILIVRVILDIVCIESTSGDKVVNQLL